MVVDVAVLCAVAGASVGCVVIGPTWRVARYPVTAVHELGHLAAAAMLGGRGARVRLRANTAGLTTWRTSRPGRGRAGVIALAGPALPPLVGAGCALAFATDRALVGVLALAAGVAVLAVVVRNVWGAIVCAALAAACWTAWRDGVGTARVLMVVSATVLCLGGVRAIAEEVKAPPRGGAGDLHVAANALRLPAALWGAALLLWALAWTCWATWRVTLAL